MTKNIVTPKKPFLVIRVKKMVQVKSLYRKTGPEMIVHVKMKQHNEQNGDSTDSVNQDFSA
jgi:hypothetical protein